MMSNFTGGGDPPPTHPPKKPQKNRSSEGKNWTLGYVGRSTKKKSDIIYSVIHISIHPSKELCSKMAPGEVGVSLP